MAEVDWDDVIIDLQDKMAAEDLDTLIRPLQLAQNDNEIKILAPNRYVFQQVKQRFMPHISKAITARSEQPESDKITLQIGGGDYSLPSSASVTADKSDYFPKDRQFVGSAKPINEILQNRVDQRNASRQFGGIPLNSKFTFDTFVEGPSNEVALAAATQIVKQPGSVYNPLLLYGGVGLGKTHLMNSIGIALLEKKKGMAKVLYLSSQAFVKEFVDALKCKKITEFTDFYQNLDALLIDDIQFFVGKLKSQEEFFHIFTTLLDKQNQMILTCDRYPSEIEGLEERLSSRFLSGLTVAIEQPDVETRVAIILKKAEGLVELSPEVAFFIAERIKSNIRELEGVLKRLVAHAEFVKSEITIDLVKDCLKDVLVAQSVRVSLDNILREVAEYFNLRVADLLSNRRSRSIARPRQIGMWLAKSVTSHSLPEIGRAFGGRDHTTVLHACRNIDKLNASNPEVAEDVKNLMRKFNS